MVFNFKRLSEKKARFSEKKNVQDIESYGHSNLNWSKFYFIFSNQRASMTTHRSFLFLRFSPLFTFRGKKKRRRVYKVTDIITTPTRQQVARWRKARPKVVRGRILRNCMCFDAPVGTYCAAFSPTASFRLSSSSTHVKHAHDTKSNR